MSKSCVAMGILAGCWLTTPALAENEGAHWYLSASGSVSLLKDSHTLVVGKPVPPGFAKTVNVIDTGPGIQFAIGHRFGNARLEIEGGYARNNSGHYIAVVPANGSIASQGGHKAWRVMVNGYYDFGRSPFRPYVGAGAGYVDIKARNFAARPPFPNEAPRLIINDDKGELAYQVMTGAAYEISPGVSLTAQYRWFSAGKVHFRDLGNSEHIREHRGHNIDLGVRVGL